MLKHYLTSALRNLLRFRTTTVINVVGLALGLACFIAALGTVTFLTTGESHFKNVDRIYAITESMHPRNVQNLDFASVRSSPPVARHLRVDFPQLEAVATARDVQDIPVAANEHLGYLHAAAVDPEFLKIFDLSFVEPSAINPLSVPNGVVITEESAQKLFGSTHVLGRSITLQNAYDVTITGVIRSIQQPSHIGTTPEHTLRFDILLTEETNWQFRRAQNPKLPAELPFAGDSWGSPVSLTYVLFPADDSFTPRMLNDQLESFTHRHSEASHNVRLRFQHTAVPIASLRLVQLDVDLFKGNGLSLATLILSLASIVLGVACVNYANLSTAQALGRARELGLQRVLGASAMQIATQQWIESGIQLVVALLLAAPLTMLGLTAFGDDATSNIGRVLASWSFWIAILAASAAVVFMLGAYTAFAILRARPVQSLRGSKANSGTGLVSRVLVGFQFATASVLIIGLVIVHEQNDVVRSQALRGHADQVADPVVVLEFPGRDAGVKFDTLKETLLRSSAIRQVSATIRTPWSTRQPSITGVSTEPGATLRNALVDFVRYDFERALGTPMLAGRSFDPKLNDTTWPNTETKIAGTYPIVINRATAKQLGWPNPNDAVNRMIYWPLWSSGNLSGDYARMQIIGVAEDNPLRFDAGPGAHLQIYALIPNVASASNFVVRIDKHRVTEALAVIDATWNAFVPYAPVKRHFMDEMFEREYRTLQRISDALSIVTCVGALIATMGLFGMATFIATRRRHEIGVRKTLGASVGSILSLLLRDFSKPVVIANILIWPIAFISMERYLELFIQRIDLTLLPFALSLIATLLIAWLAVGGQAWRAARVNPAAVLRHE